MSTTHAVGIDLGTTYSAVARLDEAGRSTMVRNVQGDLLTPSVVMFDDDEYVVGRDAKKALVTDVDRVADSPKRDMGQPHYRRKIRGNYLPPEVLQACILRRLGDGAAAALGWDFKVVITVPAYFDETRRKATADAGEMAGLAVLDIVNEPTAAALAFGEQLDYLDPAGCVRQPMKVLVYDLGGGTFDVTLIELAAGSFRTLATDGDVQLGGRDWDARLCNYAAEQFARQFQIDPRENTLARARLEKAVEDAKHTLSVRDRVDIHVECAGRACDVPVTRALFEELSVDLLERTAHTTRQLFSGGRFAWRDVNYVLLVGGSTRMPMVSRMLLELSELEPQHGVNPDEAVARGAAIYAGYLLAQADASRPGARFRVIDVNAHSLGIESIDANTMRKQNVILIPRNTSLPCSVRQTFTTQSPGQRSVVVRVLEGESKAPDQCTAVARAVLRDLPPGLPENWPIFVNYEYRSNGRVDVTAAAHGTDRNLLIEMVRESGLSDQRLSRWKAVVTNGGGGFDPFARLIAAEPATVTPTAPARPQPQAQPPLPAAAGGASLPAADLSAVANRAAAAPLVVTPSVGPNAGYELQNDARRPDPAFHSVAYAGESPTHTGESPAADEFQNEDDLTGPYVRTKRRKRGTGARTIINLVAHIMSSVLGLALGYYILCWIKPESNFLHLNLPLLPPQVHEDPDLPGMPPRTSPSPQRTPLNRDVDERR